MQQDIRFCKAADGVGLAYATSGNGPPLVMAATWLTHLEHQWRSLTWRPWLDAFGEFTVLRHDSRGCGLSDRDTDEREGAADAGTHALGLGPGEPCFHASVGINVSARRFA